MAEPMRKALQALRTVAAARVDRAGADQARATRAGAEAGAAAASADAALAEAADAWQRQVAERFDPDLGALFAHALTDRAMDRAKADERQRAATATTDRAAQAWQHEAARRQAVETQAAAAGRRARRHADERTLAITADRATLKWTRR